VAGLRQIGLPEERGSWDAGGSGDGRAGGAPQVWGEVFAGGGVCGSWGWSGMGVPGERCVGGRDGASVRGGERGGLESPGPASSRGSAAPSRPRVSGSQRQRKSLKTFFPLLPTSPSLLPLLLPLLPAVAAAAARLSLWGLGLLLGGSFPGFGRRLAPRAAQSRGCPGGASPPAPAGGLAVWRIRGGRRRGTVRGAKGGGGGDRLGAAGVLKPPRPHPGSARGGGSPRGRAWGGHRPHLAWAGSEGGPFSPAGRGRAPGSAPPTGCCLLAAEHYQSPRPRCAVTLGVGVGSTGKMTW
jgi:hypothetical protein